MPTAKFISVDPAGITKLRLRIYKLLVQYFIRENGSKPWYSGISLFLVYCLLIWLSALLPVPEKPIQMEPSQSVVQ